MPAAQQRDDLRLEVALHSELLALDGRDRMHGVARDVSCARGPPRGEETHLPCEQFRHGAGTSSIGTEGSTGAGRARSM